VSNDTYNQANIQVGHIHMVRRQPKVIGHIGILRIPP